MCITTIEVMMTNLLDLQEVKDCLYASSVRELFGDSPVKCLLQEKGWAIFNSPGTFNLGLIVKEGFVMVKIVSMITTINYRQLVGKNPGINGPELKNRVVKDIMEYEIENTMFGALFLELVDDRYMTISYRASIPQGANLVATFNTVYKELEAARTTLEFSFADYIYEGEDLDDDDEEDDELLDDEDPDSIDNPWEVGNN